MTDSVFTVSVRNSAESFTVNAVQMLHACFDDTENPMVDPSHGIAWRIKSESAIRAKLHKRGNSGGINDFIGIRILAQHIGLLGKVEQRLTQRESEVGLQRLVRKSFFELPDDSGYRAIHLDYRLVAPSSFGLPPSVTVEIQLTTWLQHLHGRLSHKLFYKATDNERKNATILLKTIADRLHQADKEIAYSLINRL